MLAKQDKLIKIDFRHSSSLVRVGSRLTLNRRGAEVSLGHEGDIAEVSDIIIQKGDSDRIFLTRDRGPHPAWSYNKIRMRTVDVVSYFNYLDGPIKKKQYYITKDVVLKKRNLKGLECKIITPLDSNNVFVEFEEDVGGCSCDSMGKRGHCIAVRSDCLDVKTESNEIKEE